MNQDEKRPRSDAVLDILIAYADRLRDSGVSHVRIGDVEMSLLPKMPDLPDLGPPNEEPTSALKEIHDRLTKGARK